VPPYNMICLEKPASNQRAFNQIRFFFSTRCMKGECTEMKG